VAIAVVGPGVARSQVNDPPVIAIPSSPSALEDTDTLVAGVSVSDPENGTLTVDLNTLEGSVNPSNVVGTPAVVNAALALLTFTPNEDYSGPATIDIAVFDGPHSVYAQILLTVDPVAPQFNLPPPPTGVEDTLLEIPGVSLSSIDGIIDVGLWSPAGTVTPNWVTGDPASINLALAQLSLLAVEDGSGSEVIYLDVFDGPHHVSAELPFTINAAPPQISLPTGATLPPDTQSVIPGISVTSIDGEVTVNLAVDIGTVDPSNVSGPAESIDAALAAVQYSPPNGFLGPVALSLDVFDGPHWESSETTIQIQAETFPAVPSIGPSGLFTMVIALMLTGAVVLRRETSIARAELFR
jgi:hypothetical protein